MARKMKTKSEIQAEIKVTLSAKQKLIAQKDSFMDKEAYSYKIVDYDSTLDALYWVLGLNDRYD